MERNVKKIDRVLEKEVEKRKRMIEKRGTKEIEKGGWIEYKYVLNC